MNKIPNDIKDINKRIDDLKEKEALLRKDKPESAFIHASKAGFRVGTELLSGVLVGIAIGYFLDKLLGTKPWLMILFMFFGSGAGILNVYRFVKNEENKTKK